LQQHRFRKINYDIGTIKKDFGEIVESMKMIDGNDEEVIITYMIVRLGKSK